MKKQWELIRDGIGQFLSNAFTLHITTGFNQGETKVKHVKYEFFIIFLFIIYSFIIYLLVSYLLWVEEVEDNLQKRTEDHSEEEDNNQDDNPVVGIIFLRLSTDGLH